MYVAGHGTWHAVELKETVVAAAKEQSGSPIAAGLSVCVCERE